MRIAPWIVGLTAWCCSVVGWAAVEPTSGGLEWQDLELSYDAQPGEAQTEFAFKFTNRAAEPIEIKQLATSCGCTAAIMPRQPWIVAPGESDAVRVIVDLRSRRGGLNKTVYVDTSAGEQLLLVHVKVPPPPAVQREMNLMLAQADRQAVFRGDCAKCHVEPTIGKRGGELFEAACVICHTDDVHRATMVPDLAKPKIERTAAFWEQWIRHGVEGSLMPAFAKAQGGPLDDEQIRSLVEYVMTHLPTQPVTQ